MLATKLGIAHALRISFEVIGLGANLLGHLRMSRADGPQRAHQFFDFSLVQQALLVDLHPGFLFDFLMRIQLSRYLPEMLAGMLEIDNLHRIRKVFGDQSPDPFRAVTDDHLLFRQAPTSF